MLVSCILINLILFFPLRKPLEINDVEPQCCGVADGARLHGVKFQSLDKTPGDLKVGAGGVGVRARGYVLSA